LRLAPTAANRIVFALALLGAGVALYLTMAHLNYLALSCGEIAGCAEVAAHPSSRGFGVRGLEYIPTAAFGLLMFLTMAALSFIRASTRRDLSVARIAMTQFALAVAAVCVSAYLTYLEAFVIHAWCQWCIGSAVITVLMLLALALTRPARQESSRI
jgi:uncharacterized membrane protein